MQSFVFPRYKSTTEWNKHGLAAPVNLETFNSLNLADICPCVFKTGHVFHWREVRAFFLDKSVLSTNDFMLEKAMWLCHELVQLLEHIQTGRNEPVYGKLVQDAYHVIQQINNLDWPTRNSNLAMMVINRDKAWSKLPPGQIKLPWFLLAPCNESLRHWLHSELILCRQRWHLAHPPIKVHDFCNYYVQAVRQLTKACNTAVICPSDYKLALEKERQLRTVDAYAWLGKKTSDDAKKLKLYEAALELATSLGTDFAADKLEKIENDTAKLRKIYIGLCGILDYTNCPGASDQLDAEPDEGDLNLDIMLNFTFF